MKTVDLYKGMALEWFRRNEEAFRVEQDAEEGSWQDMVPWHDEEDVDTLRLVVEAAVRHSFEGYLHWSAYMLFDDVVKVRAMIDLGFNMREFLQEFLWNLAWNPKGEILHRLVFLGIREDAKLMFR